MTLIRSRGKKISDQEGHTSPRFWRQLFVRRIAAVVLLVTVALIEYYLVNAPVGELQISGKFSPAQVRASEELVAFANPGSGEGKFSFSYQQPAESQSHPMLVDAYFDNAQLLDETLHKFSVLGISAPAVSSTIVYVTSSTHKAACATKVQVGTTSTLPKSMEFSQDEVALSDRHRLLETRIVGIDAVVLLESEGVFEAGTSPCKVELSVGDWKQRVQGFMPISIRVPSGQRFRLRWEAPDVRPSGWSSGGPPVSLLWFGGDTKQGFTADAVTIKPLRPPSGQPDKPTLEARAKQEKSPLNIDSLQIGTDRLEISASGKGRVLQNGKIVSTTNLIKAINDNPILAALFGAANLALIGWAGRLFFPSHRTRGQKHAA